MQHRVTLSTTLLLAVASKAREERNCTIQPKMAGIKINGENQYASQESRYEADRMGNIVPVAKAATIM